MEWDTSFLLLFVVFLSFLRLAVLFLVFLPLLRLLLCVFLASVFS